MTNSDLHATASRFKHAKNLDDVDPEDFAWAVPIMRAGYAGRALVYLVVAGVSLWSIFQGGEAEGTKSAMQSLDGPIGVITIIAIAAGLFAYAVWRLIDSFWDLEAYGTSAKGIVARIGMVVTGVVHGAIGVIAITALGYASSGSKGQKLLSDFMQSTLGSWVVTIAGLLTVATGIYYFYKAISQNYRDHLQANHFTMHWNFLLRAGLAAQGATVMIIGGLIAYSGLSSNSSGAGGLGTAFDWLKEQAFGNILVILLCLGLLGFSLFCMVNAFYRIIPKAADPSVESMAYKVQQLAS